MGKPERNIERFKEFDVMLPQGARSRFQKAIASLDDVDGLLPEDALAGELKDLQEAIRHLDRAKANLCELLAYRKMLGVD